MRFAVHGLGFPVASPRIHGVPRRDVLGRVHVSMAGIFAGGAPEGGLALARLRVHLPARRAALAGKRGVDLFDPARSFLLQTVGKQAPPRPQDRPVQLGLATNIPPWFSRRTFRSPRHVLNLQVLNPDQVELAGDIGAGLLSPVLAPVCLPGPHPGDRMSHPRTAVRAASRPGQLPLQTPQPLPLWRGQARHMQQLPGRQRRGYHNAAVDAYDLAGTRCRDRIGNDGKGQMPAPSPVQRHPVRFHFRRHRPGPAEPHPAGLRYPHLAGLPTQPPYIPLPSAPPHDPEPLAAPGFAPRRSSGWVAWVKESGHGLGEVSEGLLLDRLRARRQPRMLSTCLCELSALLQVVGGAGPAWAPMLVLLNGQVPYVSSMAAMVSQHRFLGRCGNQSVPRHANIVSMSTDIYREVKRRFDSGPAAGVPTSRSQ